MSAVPGSPYVLSFTGTISGTPSSGQVLLENSDNTNNFVDFAAANSILWISASVNNLTEFAATKRIGVWLERDGRPVRKLPPYLCAQSRQAPFPGFPITISAGRLQIQANIETTMANNDKLYVDLILAAPPAGAG